MRAGVFALCGSRPFCRTCVPCEYTSAFWLVCISVHLLGWSSGYQWSNTCVHSIESTCAMREYPDNGPALGGVFSESTCTMMNGHVAYLDLVLLWASNTKRQTNCYPPHELNMTTDITGDHNLQAADTWCCIETKAHDRSSKIAHDPNATVSNSPPQS